MHITNICCTTTKMQLTLAHKLTISRRNFGTTITNLQHKLRYACKFIKLTSKLNNDKKYALLGIYFTEIYFKFNIVLPISHKPQVLANCELWMST